MPTIADGAGCGGSSVEVARARTKKNTDPTISRVSPLFSEERSLDIRGDLFNAFNHSEYRDTATAFGTPRLGYIELKALGGARHFPVKFQF